MSVSVKETAPPAAAPAGQRRGAMLESLSRLLPSGLARRVLAAVTPTVSASSETSTTEFSNV
jgi:hypothetical protein